MLQTRAGNANRSKRKIMGTEEAEHKRRSNGFLNTSTGISTPIERIDLGGVPVKVFTVVFSTFSNALFNGLYCFFLSLVSC
jgi:hypothetical protein